MDLRKPLLFLLALQMVLLSAVGGQLEVCENCRFKDLASAFNVANSGDTILVNKGTYKTVDLEITKPITIIGREGAVLDGNNQAYILKISANDVHISGLTFVNSGISYTKDYAAIYTFKARNFTLTNNTIIKPFFGMLIEKSHNGKILGNTIYGESEREDDSGNGIHLWHCSHMEVTNNNISKLRDGIYLEFVTESLVSKNNSHNNIRYGLHFMFSNHDRYTKNTFQNNGAGVAVMFSKFILMEENQFLDNWGPTSYGLLLKEIYDGEVKNNTFKENTMGIFIEGSTRINYKNNNFISNGWAVKVSGGCYKNIFKGNNFIGNSFDVAYNGRMNDNEFSGNYWNEYTGYDLDKDGIGDVPYRPVKLFSYVVNQTPESLVLLRSLFIDIVNYSEKVSPIFTPVNLMDPEPQMKEIK